LETLKGMGAGLAWTRPLALALAVLALWLCCVLPSLERSRLEDVDELTGARVAQAAALQGAWWPLKLDGRVFFEKPPLLLWLAAGAVRISGRPRDAWPYRLWTCLGAGLALACLAYLGAMLGRPGAGLVAALALALQGDFLFHARYFTFDTPFLACVLASLVFALKARAGGERSNWWRCGLLLGLAVWFKSWFVLALVPPFAWTLAVHGPRPGRRAACLAVALPPLLALLAWLAVYAQWMGWDFLREEWSVNLAGRALGRTTQMDPEGHAAFYLKWAVESAPALLPWVLAVPLILAPGPRHARQESGDAAQAGQIDFLRTWVWAFCFSWLLGLSLLRAETINYALPLEAGLCLAAGLIAREALDRPWLCCGLLAASILASLRFWDPLIFLGSGAVLGLLWRLDGGFARMARSGNAARAAALMPPALALLLAVTLLPEASALLMRPRDPSGQLADLLLANPASHPGEPLLVLGPPTQAVEFYSNYAVRRLESVPSRRPAQATLVRTRQAWIFYPPLGAPRHGI
jgi:4-amino-4-deoxy-L-arabinose transferase-like glycosyltransferase